MPWIKVDDHYSEHRKFADAGPLGHAMWLAGMAYCNRNLTDGYIPWSVALSLLTWAFLGEPKDGSAVIYRVAIATVDGRGDDDFEVVDSHFVIDILLRVGLWEEDGYGYRVHDYEEYQPTKAQVEADKAAKVAAGQAGGLASAQARGQARPRPFGQALSKPVPVPVPEPLASPVSNETGAQDARAISKENHDERRLVGGFTAEERALMATKATEALERKEAETPKKPRPAKAPPEDEETIAKCKAILEDPTTPDWKREAAREQLVVMGVPA